MSLFFKGYFAGRAWRGFGSFLVVVGLLLGGCRSDESSARSFSQAASPDHLLVCSFNIQFLGSSVRRDDGALAELVAPYDIVVVQELIASPAASGPASRQRAKAFFDAMSARGFSWVLSESDTGRGTSLNNYSTATEWFVTFYKPEVVEPALDLPRGFVSSPLAANPSFDRVPYAFSFRTRDRRCDFVLVSVHLNPDDRNRRRVEFNGLGNWIAATQTQSSERDLIILGDTNLQDRAELHANTPGNYISLNDACVPTNVSPRSPKPYDHVLFNPVATKEIDRAYGFQVINLIDSMRPKWRGPGPYPGDPFQQNVFRFYYSDHNPVVFRMVIPAYDDD